MKLLPYLEVVFGTALFGLAFLTIKILVPTLGPLWLAAVRFLICVVVTDLVLRLAGKPLRYSSAGFRAIFLPGLFLFLELWLQAWGLKYTTPSKSGFITVLYVIFIPFFERVFFGYRIRPILFLWIAIALCGTAMICNLEISEFNFGDALTLACAVAGAGHIVAINQKLKLVSSPILFNVYQSVWIMLMALLMAPFVEGFTFTQVQWSREAWLSLAYMGLFPTILGFWIQVRAQRTIPPSTFGIVILLESPWAMLFSALFMGERLLPLQLLGAGLILLAAVGGTLSSLLKPLEL